MKALIPAAGLGKRWYPWSCVVPKELLPLGYYPAIHYVLEEAASAGIKEIGIIIREDKQLIRTYVGKIWQVNHPEVSIAWFYQLLPRGVADALLCAKDWAQDEPTAVLYPDEIHSSKGGIVQLCREYKKSSGNWIGLTANKQKRRQGILKIEKIKKNVFQIYGFCNKKRLQQIGYGTGRYILGSGLEYLIKPLSQRRPRKGKELDDTNVFSPLWDQGIRGTILHEPIFDIGTPENIYSIFSTLNIQRFTIR